VLIGAIYLIRILLINTTLKHSHFPIVEKFISCPL